MMNTNWLKPLAFLLICVGLMACSSGGGNASNGDSGKTGLISSDLQGAWYGAFRDEYGSVHTIEVIVNAGGNITGLRIGGINQGYGGTITKDGDYTFGYHLNNSFGTEGGFLLDVSATHMAFIDEDNAYGVMEKGASGFPTFSLSDFEGTWSGYSVELDTYLNTVDSYASHVTIGTGTTVAEHSGANERYGRFNGYIHSVNSGYGYAFGDWQNLDTTGTGLLGVWLSADKTFSASWACDSGGSDGVLITDVELCSFSMWAKQ